jgi:hypothetical protein
MRAVFSGKWRQEIWAELARFRDISDVSWSWLSGVRALRAFTDYLTGYY